MLLIYRFLINLILIISPIIFVIRFLKNKETFKSYREKLGFFSKKRNNGNLIWFHGASVGELQSIIPLLEKYERNNKISQILISSNTLSSLSVIKKTNLKKITHQFFPIDSNFITKKYIDYWKPSKVYFVDSEIWPNMIFNLKEKKIPINLINGRITKRTFKKWKFLSKFSKDIFTKIDLCLASSKESAKYLKRLNVQNVKFFGNLKFAQSEKKISDIDKKLSNFLKTKKVWCASSTHNKEELICAHVHLKLKKKFRNIVTIIIPRHAERADEIKSELEKLNLCVHLDEQQKKIEQNTDIYLVNSYGKTKKFFKNSKNVFLGGSLIKHGGQNPLEAARFGCNILHGPNVDNFREIYEFLGRKKVSQRINGFSSFVGKLGKLLSKKKYSKSSQQNLKIIGENILKKTFKEINI
jgi:3-deoxy-D-manno-octulosonic-acid transferase